MKKKVDVHDLQEGMYVSKLDRPWIETPFIFQGFEISNDDEINQIRQQCQYVYIDTELGDDYIASQNDAKRQQRMRYLIEEQKRIAREFSKLTESTYTRPKQKFKPYPDKTTFEEEIVEAKEITVEARDTMQSALEDVHKSRKVDIDLTNKVIGKMVDSVVRNPDALVCLSQLRNASEYSALHSIRSTILALSLGRHLVLSTEDLNTLGAAALLHDVGMAKVPQHILDKSGGLTPSEFSIMVSHVQESVDIIEQSGGLPPRAMEFVKQHHERSDGSGYPNKLVKDQISMMGAVGAIVDVYDAITSETGYRKGLSAEEVLKMMYEWRHKDFNAELVEEFIRCMGIFPIGSLVELSTEDIGVVITINRMRRLKPKVALVLNKMHRPYSQTIITDLAMHEEISGDEMKIKRVLPAGTYDINPMDYIVQL